MEKRFGPGRVLAAAACVLVLAAALVYLTGVLYFRTHFLFNTTFFGVDVSEAEPAVLDEILAERSRARTLTVQELGGGEETIVLADALGYTRSVQAPAQGWIPAGSAWGWPMSLLEERNLSRPESISYDESLLDTVVADLDAMNPENVVSPRDAYLAWQGDVCVIVPEEDGNELYPDRAAAAIARAVESGVSTVDLAAEDCYKKASISRNDEALMREWEKYEAINYQSVEIDMTGLTLTLTPDDVLGFLNGQPGSYFPDQEAVTAYVQQLKETYDTYECQRPFVNRNGTELMVGTRWDTYGFKMDAEATAALLLETLGSGERLSRIRPVWINEGLTRGENGSDIGDTYIEISIADQHLWAYVDGECVMDTSVVTGNTGNHDTPRGVFSILYKERGATLTGADYSSYVDYWMPITWSGVGLHDATWRSNFGGSIYTYDGSHGCINLPSWAASSLYGTYAAGTPVVIW